MNQNPEKFRHLKQTPLLSEHLNLNAKVVDFGGWALPVNYGSQVDEHHAVRKSVGMFDVSHMTVSDITGDETVKFLSKLLANDIRKAINKRGKAIYSCMLNDDGGVIDDLIVYYLNDDHCRLVTNAATNKKDMAWILKQSNSFSVQVQEKPDLALIAIQGPSALDSITQALPEFAPLTNSLSRFQGGFISDDDPNSTFIGRTGYTGEDGVEIIIHKDNVVGVWQTLIDHGITPCGLGARDTLRLEAGMALYGNDLEETYTPLESGLSWTVALDDDREFIGKAAFKKPAEYQMIGLLLEERGVLRSHYPIIINNEKVGEITSGTFSPSLEKSIALARINANVVTNINDKAYVEVRNKTLQWRIIKYPFFLNGQATYS